MAVGGYDEVLAYLARLGLVKDRPHYREAQP